MFKVGDTPLTRLKQINVAEPECAHICAKLESFNPAGSAKDRVALQMIEDGFSQGVLNKNTTIIEPTSGNTGIGLAAVAKDMGLKCIIVMPDNMSKQRIELIETYGAEIVLTPGSLGMTGSIDKANEIHQTISCSWIAGQFDNPSNWKAHYNTTGPEIWEQTNHKIDAFVAGVGTGGTITGVGKFLKEKNPDIKIVGIEPASSAVLSGGNAGPHAIQGIGAGFVPNVLDVNIMDDIIQITDKDAMKYFDFLNEQEKISAGISSGAALAGAIKYSKAHLDIKNIVILCPDGIDRYK